MKIEKLKPWNGITPFGKELPDNCKNREYMQDDEGTIYYKNDEGEWNIWCPASRLEQHVHHLNQIFSRR